MTTTLAAAAGATDALVYVQAHAIIRSTRAGALDPLDPNSPHDAVLARYWAEPAMIADATGQLEDMGFDVIRCDRMGVHILAEKGDLERNFGIGLELDRTDPDRPVWRDTTKKTVVETILPTSAQAGWLRGLRLPPLLPGHADKKLVDYENDWRNTNYKYQTLPHQLRRELCMADPGTSTTKFGSGTHVKILVVDSGFDGSHPYWAEVPHPTTPNTALDKSAEAIGNKTVIADFYLNIRGGLTGAIEGIKKRLDAASAEFATEWGKLDAARTDDQRTKIKGSLIASFKKIMKEYLAALKHVSADAAEDAKFDDVAPEDPRFFTEPYHDEVFGGATLMSGSLSDRIKDLAPTNVPKEDWNWPHGTMVVSELLAIAPDAVIRVIAMPCETRDGRLPSSAFSYAWLADYIRRLKPRLVSLSFVGTRKADPIEEFETRNFADFSSYMEMIMAAKDCGSLIFNSVGNLESVYQSQAGGYYDLSRPWPVGEQQVSASAMIAHANLLNVGGAWWAQRHDLAKSPRAASDLSASRYSMGYSVPPKATANFAGVRTPQICGLGGPAFDQLADVKDGGLNVVPVIMHDAPSGQNTQQMLTLSGTSIAAPQVCGVAALVLEAHAGLDVDGLRQTLLNTTREIPSPQPKDVTRSFTKPDKADDILDLPHGGGKPGMVDLAAALTYDQTGLTTARQVSAQRSFDALAGALKPDGKS